MFFPFSFGKATDSIIDLNVENEDFNGNLGAVYGVAEEPNSDDLYLLGWFQNVVERNSYKQRNVLSLNLDGTLNNTLDGFILGSIDDPYNFAVAVDGDYLYISPQQIGVNYRYTYKFEQINPIDTWAIFRYNLVTKQIDETFVAEFFGQLISIDVVGDSLFVTGNFNTVNGVSSPRLAKISKFTGALDSTFSVGTGAIGATGVYVDPLESSKIYVPGVANYNGTTTGRLVKLDINTGALDTTFHNGLGSTGFSGGVLSMRSDSSGLYVAGGFTNYQGNTAYKYFLKISKTNAAIIPFVTGLFNATCRKILKYGNNLWVAGDFTQHNGTAHWYHCTIDITTGVVSQIPILISEQAQGRAYYGWDVAITNDEQTVYIGGNFIHQSDRSKSVLVAISTATGQFATTFTRQSCTDRGGRNIITKTVVVGNQLFIAGMLPIYGDSCKFVKTVGICKVNKKTGKLDNNFIFDGSDTAIFNYYRHAVILGDYIYATGTSRADSSESIVKINKNTGQKDTTFKTNIGTGIPINSTGWSIATNGTHLFIGGDFTSFNGQTVSRLVKLDLDGNFQSGFYSTTTGNPNNLVYAVECDSNGDVVIGGRFTTVAGYTVGRIAKLNKNNGTLVTGWSGYLYDGAVETSWIIKLPNDEFLISGPQNYNSGSHVFPRWVHTSPNGSPYLYLDNTIAKPPLTPWRLSIEPDDVFPYYKYLYMTVNNYGIVVDGVSRKTNVLQLKINQSTPTFTIDYNYNFKCAVQRYNTQTTPYGAYSTKNSVIVFGQFHNYINLDETKQRLEFGITTVNKQTGIPIKVLK